jgi:ring-1,2-phenylacetyl-CoA epoxidase subunit PaaE
MSIHFHSLTIKEVRSETPDCVSISFHIPTELQSVFKFSHGQNLTVKTKIGNEEVRRSYSICTAPFENELRVAVKRVESGLFSTFAHQLNAGDVLDVLPPTGRFYTQLDPKNKKNYLAFAAGSGITPVISIIKTTLATEPNSTFTIVYGNRSRSSIIFLEELEGLKNKYLERFNLIHVLSRERTDTSLNFGRINAEKLAQLHKVIDFSSMDEIFLCGPEEMIFTAKEFLEASGVDQKKIHFELFTVPGEKSRESGVRSRESEVANDKGPKAKITLKLDGRSFDFDLAFDGDTILDGALKLGADLPFACKGGVCSTCRAKLVEGEVEMEMNWALEPEEVEQGFILTCQSHPKTERVVVDYDLR